MESPLGTLGVSVESVPKVPRCRIGLEGTCDPGQARFSASLINAVSGPVHDWIGTEVVFHSPEVLRSRGESSADLGGFRQLSAQDDPVLAPTGRG